MRIEFLQGNDACVESAILSGCRFYAGYPITPSTEIAEGMAKKLPTVKGVFIQMEDEIASICACIGASWTGIKSMTATSGPGFSLMQENIGYACMTETPLVIVNSMRGGPSTGQPTMASQGDILQAKHGSHGDYEIIALYPNSVQEFFDFTNLAFNLSEKYRSVVILFSDGELSHMREKVIFPDKIEIVNREEFPYGKVELPFAGEIPKFPTLGKGHRVHITGLTHDETGMPLPEDTEVHEKLIKRICNKILNNKDKICKYEVINKNAKKFIIAYGLPSRSALEVVRKNENIGLFRLKTIFPFPEEFLKAELKNAEDVLVLEMNNGQLFYEIERVVCKIGVKARLFSKLGGEVHKPSEIMERI